MFQAKLSFTKRKHINFCTKTEWAIYLDYIQVRRQKYETVTVCQDKKSGGDFVQFFEHKIETFSSRENFKKHYLTSYNFCTNCAVLLWK